MKDKQQMNAVWSSIAQDSYDFEHSMNQLHRKQTGSYYTSLDLTLTMMREMVDSAPIDWKKNLYKKKFLEPCVGTGNFVFAYLRVCYEQGFSKDQWKQLLNNIYVCDINKEALDIYIKNLRMFSLKILNIELQNDYFFKHIGSGLMLNVESSKPTYIPINMVFDKEIVGNGFDFVATNPPYKNLKAEKSHYVNEEIYNEDKRRYTKIAKITRNQFCYSTAGTLNLYKMFVEEIVERYASNKGICSLLIPSSILSDKTCSKLRTRLLEKNTIKSLRVIAENNNYVDASQSLCAMLLHRGEKTKQIFIDVAFNGDAKHGKYVVADDFLEPATGNAILALTDDEYRVRKKMQEYPVIKNIPYIVNLRGELDMTVNKNAIQSDKTSHKMLRGRNVGFYKHIEASVDEYVNEEFVEKSNKKMYIHHPRLICQQIANMAKKRRIAFSLIPAEYVLGNSCNFISILDNEDNVNSWFLLGILNSKLINWFFKLTSSNNHINNYEIDNFPIPIHYERKEEIEALVKNYIETRNEEVLQQIEWLVEEAYGLRQNSELDKGLDETSIIDNRHKLKKKFFDVIRRYVPNVTREECYSVITGVESLGRLLEKNNIKENLFDRKVIEGLGTKFRALYSGNILNHTTFKLSDLDLEMIKAIPQGGNWQDIPLETVKKSKRLTRITQTGGRTTLYGRIDYSKPSYTITTYFNRPGNGTYVHPIHERVLSVREAARFQTFPDEYFFYGNKGEVLKQVGNAVPVILAYNIGKAIKGKTGCCTSVDLFSGAGGMTYGFKQAGIQAVIANDIVENACVTLKINSPEIPVFCGDITTTETKKVIIKAGKKGGADIICGGPPCQGFSMAGWRMKDDPRNQLFRHFVDIVSGVNPKIIVFENVEGILSFQGGETYQNIIELFSELGYYTEGRKLMANHFGVPQKRKRVIILCTRKDIGVLPKDIFPAPITIDEYKQITAYQTIFDLESVSCCDEAKYSSEYTSDILKVLKGQIDMEEYIRRVACVNNTGNEVDSYYTTKSKLLNKKNNYSNLIKSKDSEIPGGRQLSLFDF